MKNQKQGGPIPHPSQFDESQPEPNLISRQVKALGLEIPLLMFVGVVTGIIIAVIYFVANPAVFLQPVIGNAVRATIEAMSTPLSNFSVVPTAVTPSPSNGNGAVQNSVATTATPSSKVNTDSLTLFSDDFENGTSKWNINDLPLWELFQQNDGHRALCINNYNNPAVFATAGDSRWDNYAVKVDFWMDSLFSDNRILLGIRVDQQRKYQISITDHQINLYRIDPSYQTGSTLLKTVDISPSLADGSWHTANFSAINGTLSFWINLLTLDYTDSNYLTNGNILIGADPNSHVCFDNLVVKKLLK